MLPAGYTELTHIESTGTQYIDTEYIPNENTEVELTFQMTDLNTTNNHALFAVAGQFSFKWITSKQYFRSVGGSDGNFPKNIDTTIKHTVIKTATKTILDNEYTVTTTVGDVSLSLYLFAQHNASNISAPSRNKTFECFIREKGVTLKHLIPCQTPNNEVGMYDDVNKKFHGNIGTGVFIAGNPVDPVVSFFRNVKSLEMSEGYVTKITRKEDDSLIWENN